MSPKRRADRNGERVPVTLARLEGKLDVIQNDIHHIKETEDRQEECIERHSVKIDSLEKDNNRMKGIGAAVAFVLATLGVLAAL